MNRRDFTLTAAAAVAGLATPAVASPRLDIASEIGALAELLPLHDALVASDLIGLLAHRGPYTVFAPTRRAFDRLSYQTKAFLMSSPRRPELRRIMAFHVVEGAHSAFDMMGRTTTLRTLIGRPLVVDGRGSGLRIGTTHVGLAEIQASNGYVHQIDQVLRPA